MEGLEDKFEEIFQKVKQREKEIEKQKEKMKRKEKKRKLEYWSGTLNIWIMDITERESRTERSHQLKMELKDIRFHVERHLQVLSAMGSNRPVPEVPTWDVRTMVVREVWRGTQREDPVASKVEKGLYTKHQESGCFGLLNSNTKRK